MKDLFRRKPVAYDNTDHGLKKCLSALDLTLLGIGAIIGTGIFVLTGHAAATQSGPAVVLSFLVAGVACAFAALAYAELAASVGGCGSAYGYSYAAFGELIAWIIAWDLILEYGVSVAAVANGWSGYFNNALTAIGIGLPEALTKGPTPLAWNGYLGGALEMMGFDPTDKDVVAGGLGGIVNLPAVIVILGLMLMLIAGVKETARINAVAVMIKLVAVAVFVGVAIFNVNPDNWSPFMPFGWFSHGADDKPVGILAGASLVFFAYVGFDAVSTAVEEAKNPQRDVPIGILAALIFCTVIYIIVSALMTGIVPYTALNVSSPASEALLLIGYNTAAGVVSGCVIFGLTTVMLVLYYGLTRIIVGVSRDGLLPVFFSGVNPRTHTPVRTTVMTGIVMAIMAGLIPLGVLAELVNIGTLAAFVLVCCGVMMLRRTHPDMHRPFRAPLGDLFALMGALSCSALIAFLPWETHLRFIVWLAVGLLIYFGYSRRNSKLAGQAAAVSETLTWAERTEHLGMVRNSQNQHQGHSGFGTGFGIAALVVAILAIFVPVVGIFVSGVALVLAALAALAGDRVFAVATPLIAGVNTFLLSPTTWGALANDAYFTTVVLAFLALPLLAIAVNASGKIALNKRRKV